MTVNRSPLTSLPKARIKHLDKVCVPLLDNFHVVWLEREKQRWVENSWITTEEKNSLPCGVGFANTIRHLGGKRCEASTREIQDVYIKPTGRDIPSLVVESGTILDKEELVKDMKIWMKRGKGDVKKVILMIWIMLPGGFMGGRIEVYEYRKQGGMHTGKLTQQWVFIPGDEESTKKSVVLKKSDLCLAGRDERIELRIKNLYDESIEAIESSNLRIADEDDFRNAQQPTNRSGGTNINSGNNYTDSFNTKIDNSEHTHNYSITHLHFPKTLTDFLTTVFNKVAKLGAFYDEIDKQEELAKKFYGNIGPALKQLELEKYDTANLSTVALYDVMILCDDSGSMAYGNRYNLLSETVRRIVPVATKLNECGISLRFINYTQDQEFNKISEAKDADRKLAAVKPRGTTKIGTVLRTKIIDPVLEKARTGKLVMPVLVVIITDGEPSYELPDTMKKAILYCKQSLEEIQTTKGHVYGGAAVVFQISYIGDSQDAEDFVRNLSTDPEVGNMIHCNLNRLDIQLGAEGNCARNRSLLELLSAAIKKS